MLRVLIRLNLSDLVLIPPLNGMLIPVETFADILNVFLLQKLDKMIPPTGGIFICSGLFAYKIGSCPDE